MKATHVPLVVAGMVGPFVSAIESAGKNPDPLLEKLGLSKEDLERGDKYIPGQVWYDSCEAAAALLNDPHLGYNIGAQAALDRLPNLDILRLPHATLGELLNALVIDASRITSLASYKVGTDGTTAWLETRRRFRPVGTPAQIDGYFAGFMQRILRMCTGPAWQVSRVSITISDPSAIPKQELPGAIYRDVELLGAQFAFPAVWLLQRTDGAMRQTLHVRGSESVVEIDAIRTLLERHLDQPGLTLRRFAELTGASPDRLKRLLVANGTSYAKERDQLRATRARMLLATSSTDISQIGTLVGHPDAPGFSRSFRRWTGETPRNWRAKNQGDKENSR